jgi:hypothetical protein
MAGRKLRLLAPEKPIRDTAGDTTRRSSQWIGDEARDR